MFKKLFSQIRSRAPGQPQSKDAVAEQDDSALQLAFAALLVEAARSDDQYEIQESALIDRALKAKFTLNDAQALQLRAKAETAQGDATDIQRFTRIAKAMSHDEKIALLEEMWEIILSDGARDPFEDTLMRRICGLIYVDDQDSGAARARVAARI